ncbi:hypothetical protein ABT381_15570 [Streptomyces sp. NPDC000151]|uniref:hypothetical protein n=1 Tax=Streptomyces sp. NPDC000151 TaxID=3154244 RepID=UPI0033317510
MRVSRLSCAALSGAVATMVFGVIPAHAEGSKTTYISNWATGYESSRWHDTNSDGASTTVRFSGCSIPSSPGTKASATVSVWKDTFGPDTNYGSKSNACSSTLSWGDRAKADYYFVLDKINGASGSGTFHLNAKTVTIKW